MPFCAFLVASTKGCRTHWHWLLPPGPPPTEVYPSNRGPPLPGNQLRDYPQTFSESHFKMASLF